MGELIIRKGLSNDIDKIFALEQVCFTSPWTREMIRRDIEENRFGTYIVAELDGNIVGYIGFWSIVDECQIVNVAVSPVLRGQSIGTFLVDTVLSATKDAGIKRWTLEVRAGNEAAKALYRKLGFVEDAVRKDYYDDPKEDAILMSR